jgi:hypothetical protein
MCHTVVTAIEMFIYHGIPRKTIRNQANVQCRRRGRREHDLSLFLVTADSIWWYRGVWDQSDKNLSLISLSITMISVPVVVKEHIQHSNLK